MSQDFPCNEMIRVTREQGTHNQLQNITKQHAFQGGSIMVWTGILLGYCTKMHIFRQDSAMAVWYQDEDPTVRLYTAAVGHVFILKNDNAHPHRAAIIDDRCPWPLYAHVSLYQPLSQSCKVLYSRNADYLVLWWLIKSCNTQSHTVNFCILMRGDHTFY